MEPKGKSGSAKNERSSNNQQKKGKNVPLRKPPIIKQTLTSLYRIAKANPLLVLKDGTAEDQVDDFGLGNMKLPKSVLLPSVQCNSDGDKLAVKSFGLKSNISKKEQKSAPISRTVSLKFNKKKSTNNNIQLTRTDTVRTQPSTSSKLEPQGAVKKQKRRSLSAEHYDRKKQMCTTKAVQLLDTKEVTQSLNNIGKKTVLATVSPIIEEIRTVTFRTPSAYKRRSISSSTPTPFCRHFASTPVPAAADDLQHRLEEWLRNHQKPINSYKHLKCFGLRHSRLDNYANLDEENKENIEDVNLTKSTSYENLKISFDHPSTSSVTTSTTASNNKNGYADNRTIAQDALIDLHKLILDGYSQQQCEAWLGMIRQKYKSLDEEPQYWECRAAIEQNRGNITSAVECLRTAIVQGAEVKAVDHSLEQLLRKFSLLNISASDQNKDDMNMKKDDRARIILDARSVFKSSIIQFAVQERTLKKKPMQGETTSEKKFIATPVRRSTRQNRSGYTVTPHVKLCASLHELDENTSNSLNFHSNIALLDRVYD